MPLLLTRAINVTGQFLYPAYCSYKVLGRRPLSDADGELERWLQYWSLVGAWTALEGAIGWLLGWLPFYTLFKTAIFLYLAISSTGTPYVYNNFLEPLFAEHEPAIDEFIGSVRGQAGTHARGGLGWIYERIRQALGLTPQQAAYLSQQGGYQAPTTSAVGSGPATAPQPPTLADPASGAVQHAAGMLQGLASRYLPAALAAVSAAAGSAQQTASRGFDVPAPPVPPKFDSSSGSGSTSTGPAPSAPAGSRAFSFAQEDAYASSHGSRGASQATARAFNSRSSSDGSISAGSNLASSFTEIRREEAEGTAENRPPVGRASSGSWMPWGAAGTPTPKDKSQ